MYVLTGRSSSFFYDSESTENASNKIKLFHLQIVRNSAGGCNAC